MASSFGKRRSYQQLVMCHCHHRTTLSTAPTKGLKKILEDATTAMARKAESAHSNRLYYSYIYMAVLRIVRD